MIPLVIGVCTYGRGAASARVRLYQWLDRLRVESRVLDYVGSKDNSGTSLLKEPGSVLCAEVRLRRLEHQLLLGAADTLIVSRRASPFGFGGIEGRFFSTPVRTVYDFDDALMTRPASMLVNHELKWCSSVRSADVVIAGNAELAERATKLSGEVVMIPSCVEPADYPPKRVFSISDPPVAVWLGSPATESFLMRIERALLRAHRETGMRLRVVSAGRRPLGRLDQMVDRVEWDGDTFASELGSSDLGVMPLPDDAWTRGKCAYKLIGYGAVGLPLVGDPVGSSAGVLNLTRGVAPRSVHEWADALIGLVRTGAGERAAMGNAARRAVVEHYSYSAWQDVWRDVVGV